MSAPGSIRRLTTGSRTDWETPQALFAKLHSEFQFTIDGAASKRNAKLARFYDDAFRAFPFRETIFVNPPYGREEQVCVPSRCRRKTCRERGFHVEAHVPGMDAWIDLFARWSDSTHESTVASLVTNATEADWARTAWSSAWEMRLVGPGRVPFELDGVPQSGNTGGSVIYVWRPGPRPYPAPVVTYWSWK